MHKHCANHESHDQRECVPTAWEIRNEIFHRLSYGEEW